MNQELLISDRNSTSCYQNFQITNEWYSFCAQSEQQVRPRASQISLCLCLFYFVMDLNIIIGSDKQRDSDQLINQKVKECMKLGYQTIALSQIVDITNEKGLSIIEPPDVGLYSLGNLKILTRLTVKVADPMDLYKLSRCKVADKYELLAIEPQNDKILSYICEGKTDLAILTFNLSERLSCNLFRISYKILGDRGVCAEINYGPALMGSSLRRNVICNGQNLIEKAKKNVILSSGIEDPFRFRSPLDVKSIGVLFLMTTNQSHDAVFKNATKAINTAKFKRQPAASAIELVK